MSGLLVLMIWQHRTQQMTYNRNVTALMADQMGRSLENAFTRQTRLLSRLRAEDKLLGEPLGLEQITKEIAAYPAIFSLVRIDEKGAATVAWSNTATLPIGSTFSQVKNLKWQHALSAGRNDGTVHLVSGDDRRLDTVWIIAPFAKDPQELRAYAVGVQMSEFVPSQIGPKLQSQFALTLLDKNQRLRFNSGTPGDARIHDAVTVQCIDAAWTLKVAPTTSFLSAGPSSSNELLLYTAIAITVVIPCAVLRLNLKRQTEREQARRRLSAIEGLNRVAGELLSAANDAKSLLKLLSETAADVFDMPTVTVLVPRNQGREVEVAYWRGTTPPPKPVYLIDELPATRHCLLSQQFMFTEDVNVNPAGFQQSLLQQHQIRASILLPMVVRGESIGALNLCARQPRKFSEFDRSLMRLFSHQAAIILGQSQLLEQLRDHLETNRVLLHELNHRVKNNLNGIQGLLVMDQPELSGDAQAWLDRVSQRIETMARAHELFSGHRPHMRLDEFLRTTINSVAAIKPGAVQLSLDLGDAGAVRLSGDHAVTLAIVINELCYNALVHGAGADGEVHVQVRSDDPGKLQISIIDVPGLDRTDRGGVATVARNSTGVGLSLVSGLITRELGGTLEFLHGPGGGTCAQVTIPLVSDES